MRSETVAESSDSIAPSIATVMAGASSGWIKCGLNVGTCNGGNPAGTAPNRDPMVSTGRRNSATASVPSTSATIVPGMRAESFGTPSTTASVATASPALNGENCGSACATSISRGRNTPDGCAIGRPKKSLICVLAISTAMPFVNPITTGRGMKRTAVPIPVTPSSKISTPAMSVIV